MNGHTERPSILEVIGHYVSLRRSGREFGGLCPFHAEKTPSFTVNEEKGVFHCFGCGASGDVIRFIELIEGVDFKGALAHLGLTGDSDFKPNPRREIQKQTARAISEWANETAIAIGARMRELGQRERMAKQVSKLSGADREFLTGDNLAAPGEVGRCGIEWEILAAFQEDLFDPENLTALWEERDSLERIVNGY